MLILTHPGNNDIYNPYKVKVNGISADTYRSRVSAIPYNTAWPGHQRPLDQTELCPVLSFSSDQKVKIDVTYTYTPSEVIVRPISKGVKADICNNKVSFELSESGSYTLEADGFHGALHIFFDEISDFEEYAKGKSTVIRYGAGVHNIGKKELFSDTTVIIDRDATIYGSFISVGCENVSVCGYGIIDGSLEERDDDSSLLPLDYYTPISYDKQDIFDLIEKNHVLDGIVRFYRCKNINVDGITMRDSSTFGLICASCENIQINNVKAIGMWKYNSDGIDLFNCKDAVIKSCFLRCFDDCIVLKGICGWDLVGIENILVENCVTWCDWGRNLEIGAETNAPYYKNIVFRNCDCIHASTIFCDIHHHNRAHISDVLFENIRCEYTKHQLSDTYQHNMDEPFVKAYPIRHPLLLTAAIYDMGLFSKDGLHGDISDVTFRDIKVFTDSDDILYPIVVMTGLDEIHKIDNILIDTISRNGKKLEKNDIDWHINEYAHNVEFK